VPRQQQLYGNTPTACYSCHQADFTGTTNPNHVSFGLPNRLLHVPLDERLDLVVFQSRHNRLSADGRAHLTTPCATCHVNNNYTTLPTACYGCHQADWNGTNNPSARRGGLPHHLRYVPHNNRLVGRDLQSQQHAVPSDRRAYTVSCILCHVNNVFAGTPTACYSCHQADFTGTTNPNHVTAGWPTTCTTCHTTTAWLPATLPASYHTFFPLNSRERQ
jgi:predicted CXXCH cytochrome family protein